MRAMASVVVVLAGCAKAPAPLPRIDLSSCPDPAEHRGLGLGADALYAEILAGPSGTLDAEALTSWSLVEQPAKVSEYHRAAGASPTASWTVACAQAAYLSHLSALRPPATFSEPLQRAWWDVFDESIRPALTDLRRRATEQADRAAASGEPFAPRAAALAAALREAGD